MINIKKLAIEGLQAKPNNVWPTYGGGGSLDRTKFVTSSEVGYCPRKVFYDKQALRASKYSPQEGTTSGAEVGDSWGVMQRGHTAEAWLVEQLLRTDMLGDKLQFAGDNQVSFYNQYQAGTPDGLMLIDSQYWLLEIKSIDPRTNVSNLPRDTHIGQITQNCDLVGQHFDVFGALIVYIDASNYANMYQYEIAFDETAYIEADRLMTVAEQIMTATDAAELPPTGVHLDHCKYCKHTAPCSALVRENVNKGMKHNVSITASAKRLFG